MNYWKILAVLLGLFSFGALQETHRIFTSSDNDIAENRASLVPIALGLTSAFIAGAIYCWKKSRQKNYKE